MPVSCGNSCFHHGNPTSELRWTTDSDLSESIFHLQNHQRLIIPNNEVPPRTLVNRHDWVGVSHWGTMGRELPGVDIPGIGRIPNHGDATAMSDDIEHPADANPRPHRWLVPTPPMIDSMDMEGELRPGTRHGFDACRGDDITSRARCQCTGMPLAGNGRSDNTSIVSKDFSNAESLLLDCSHNHIMNTHGEAQRRTGQPKPSRSESQPCLERISAFSELEIL